MAASFDEASTLPPAFYCPISLDLMTDPVTLSSGITYDRASIQPWFAAGHRTCPVTRQPLLPHPFFIPNHTLLRIIRTWCYTHSTVYQDSAAHSPSIIVAAASATTSSSPSAVVEGHFRIGPLCRDALFNLGLLDSLTSDLLPHDHAASLLISLLSTHYGAAACRGELLAERICEEAAAALSTLTLSSHHLSTLAHPHVFNFLSCLLHSSHRQGTVIHNYASLLAKLISQHPSQRAFLRSLSSESLSTLVGGLTQFLKHSNPSPFLAQHILHCICLVCKSSRTTLLTLTDATSAALVQLALDRLLHTARQGRSMPNLLLSDTAISLLHILAACAEGRAAIASHAFAVPAIAKYLQRGMSEAATESAVVVLWKLCRYSSEERVRRQAMEACVASKLVLLMQASHCSARAKSKAGALVRLLDKRRQ